MANESQVAVSSAGSTGANSDGFLKIHAELPA